MMRRMFLSWAWSVPHRSCTTCYDHQVHIGSRWSTWSTVDDIGDLNDLDYLNRLDHVDNVDNVDHLDDHLYDLFSWLSTWYVWSAWTTWATWSIWSVWSTWYIYDLDRDLPGVWFFWPPIIFKMAPVEDMLIDCVEVFWKRERSKNKLPSVYAMLDFAGGEIPALEAQAAMGPSIQCWIYRQ